MQKFKFESWPKGKHVVIDRPTQKKKRPSAKRKALRAKRAKEARESDHYMAKRIKIGNRAGGVQRVDLNTYNPKSQEWSDKGSNASKRRLAQKLQLAARNAFRESKPELMEQKSRDKVLNLWVKSRRERRHHIFRNRILHTMGICPA